MNLSGKNTLIMGGGSGIGLAIAEQFASIGSSVAIAGRDEAKLRQSASSIDVSPAVRFHAVDVADRQSVNALVEWFQGSIGPVDILVNSAGVNIKTRSMAEMTPEQWDRVMAINATGAYNCMYAVLPQMRERHDGLIINISSISGKRASELGGIAYCASKFAMTALGTAVNGEDGQNGIRVTNVYPGEVDTPILEHRPSPVSDEHRARILQPGDVASVVTAIACLPSRANVPEVVVKPSLQGYV